ncbi:hypothetical protein HEK616_36780 [Streptomyces nigrescens]|uniref:Uncharacterized protein n=1 Tax=Streptomyces nigrescens TaxID=1920 RepID=A0ABM7ZUY3_STRNI|nr:hypothetical protein HEK616_36780 [Streptomyces nigrescens]
MGVAGQDADDQGTPFASDRTCILEPGLSRSTRLGNVVDGILVYDLAPHFHEMGPGGEVREPAWPREMFANYLTGSRR